MVFIIWHARQGITLGAKTILSVGFNRGKLEYIGALANDATASASAVSRRLICNRMDEPEDAAPGIKIAPLLDRRWNNWASKDHDAIVLLRFFRPQEFQGKVGAGFGGK